MRYLPGQPADIIQESITSYSLIKAMVNNPDIIPTVYRLWGDDITPLSAMLSLKGMKTKGLFDGSAKGPYRVVKSNHVQYAIENDDRRKMRVKAVTFPNAATTATYYCPAYALQPGFKQSSVYIGFDTNYAGPKTVLELDDNMTKIYFIDDQLPQEAPEGWIYECKIIAGHNDAFIDPALLAEGAEVAVVMDMYEHDFSETGPETNFQFDGWGHAYMTLQRVKLSWSGTAEAMGSNGALWTVHNGQKSFLTVAEDKMMRQAAAFHEYQIIFGKGTVTVDGDVLMKDKRNREILAGDGIVHQNDGSYEYPYNKWSLGFLEGVMQDLEIRHNKDGLLEVVLLGGRSSLFEFSKLMAESGFVTAHHNVDDPDAGAKKGVINTYSFYEIAGVRIIPKLYSWLDSPNRPTKWLADGTKRSSYDGFLVPLGTTATGANGIELVQLRPPKTGQVNGINVGGDMATSVDGTHKHYLFQTGVICRIKTARIFRPYPYTSTHAFFN